MTRHASFPTALAWSCLGLLLVGGVAARSDSTAVGELAILDANGDGTLDPYEALDVLLMLEKDLGPDRGHARYNALLQRMASFADALSGAGKRTP